MNARRLCSAFSALELLIVIGILALLLVILLPAISKARTASRSTVCLANLQQWGQLYNTYLASNKVLALPEMGDAQDGNDPTYWWEALAPRDAARMLLCIEARVSRTDVPPPGDQQPMNAGTAVAPWTLKTTRGNYDGSYGLNLWATRRNTPGLSNLMIQYPTREASEIPLLGDCTVPWEVPTSGSRVPTDLIEGSTGIGNYCVDRHNRAVNILFLDGHAERVTLANLWKLKWHQNYLPVDVTIPG